MITMAQAPSHQSLSTLIAIRTITPLPPRNALITPLLQLPDVLDATRSGRFLLQVWSRSGSDPQAVCRTVCDYLHASGIELQDEGIIYSR